MQSVPLSNNLSNEDKSDGFNSINEVERISKIPENISNIRKDNVEFEKSIVQQTKQHRRIFKIIVIGDSNVGKTCLTYRFCGGRFLQRSEATIGVDFREKTIQIDDEAIKLQIWDTAGQERFRKSMIAHYYRNVHAVLFVYDVTNLQSFQNLSFWIEEYNKNCGSDSSIPRILVGNKCDLSEEQAVNTNSAQTFADMHQMPLFETSAKDDSKQDNVEAIFMTLAFKLKSSKPFYIPNQLHKVGLQNVNNRATPEETGSCYC